VHQAVGVRADERVPKNTRETVRALRPSVVLVVVVVVVQKVVAVRKIHRLWRGTAGVCRWAIHDTRYIGDCAREMRYMKPGGECSRGCKNCEGVHIYT